MISRRCLLVLVAVILLFACSVSARAKAPYPATEKHEHRAPDYPNVRNLKIATTEEAGGLVSSKITSSQVTHECHAASLLSVAVFAGSECQS
jgi:hypothetical protein